MHNWRPIRIYSEPYEETIGITSKQLQKKAGIVRNEKSWVVYIELVDQMFVGNIMTKEIDRAS